MRILRLFALAAAAMTLGPTAAQAQEHIAGMFYYKESIDPIDDVRRTIVLALAPESAVAISWQCVNDTKQELIIATTDFRVHTFYETAGDLYRPFTRVRWRVDGDSARSGLWWPLRGDRGAIAPSDAIPDLTSSVRAGNRLIIELFDAGGTRRLYTFNLSGSTKAIGRLECF